MADAPDRLDGSWMRLVLNNGETLYGTFLFRSFGMGCYYPGFFDEDGTYVPLHAVLVAHRTAGRSKG